MHNNHFIHKSSQKLNEALQYTSFLSKPPTNPQCAPLGDAATNSVKQKSASLCAFFKKKIISITINDILA